MQNMLKSYNPATGEEIGAVKISSPEEIEQKVSLARGAAPGWQKLGMDKRLSLIEEAWSGTESRARELIELIGKEMGKDIRRAAGEVNGTFYGGPYLAREVRDALQSRDAGDKTRVEYRPLGVAAVISPWNYPLAMANNLIVPALMAGNPVVFKPSEQTPLVANLFVDLLNRVLPENVLQIVHGHGEQGGTLVESPVNIIAFTGSRAAGKDIMARAAGGIKRLIMELGGNDPMIVLADADIEAAVRFAVGSSFENAGQMCTSTERIYVAKQVAEEFGSRVTAIAAMYKTGPWDRPGVNIGPIVNDSPYGLGAVVFGQKEAQDVADCLEAGMIGINQGVGGSGNVPWVGSKQSGFGFHGSHDGHRQFAQIRVVSY